MDSNHRPPGYGPGELPLLHPTILEGNPAEGPCLPTAPPPALHGSGLGPPGAPSFPLRHHASPIPRPPKRLRGEWIPNAFLRGNGTTHTASTPYPGPADRQTPASPDPKQTCMRRFLSPANSRYYSTFSKNSDGIYCRLPNAKIRKFPEIQIFFSRFTKILSFSPKIIHSSRKKPKFRRAPILKDTGTPPAMPFGRSQRSTEVPPRPSSHSSRFHVHPDAVPFPRTSSPSPRKGFPLRSAHPCRGRAAPALRASPHSVRGHFPIKTGKTDERKKIREGKTRGWREK